MKSRFCLYAIGPALLTVPAAAAAQGITYDCDTAAGHFSELVLPAGTTPFTVTGNVRLNAVTTDKTYAAMIRVQISAASAPGQSPTLFAGFSLDALPVDPNKAPSGVPAIQGFRWRANGTKDEILPQSLLTKPGTVQPFTLAYDGDKVTVTLGADAKSFPLKTTDPVVRVTCSTGEFLLTDLTIKSAR